MILVIKITLMQCRYAKHHSLRVTCKSSFLCNFYSGRRQYRAYSLEECSATLTLRCPLSHIITRIHIHTVIGNAGKRSRPSKRQLIRSITSEFSATSVKFIIADCLQNSLMGVWSSPRTPRSILSWTVICVIITVVGSRNSRHGNADKEMIDIATKQSTTLLVTNFAVCGVDRVPSVWRKKHVLCQNVHVFNRNSMCSLSVRTGT